MDKISVFVEAKGDEPRKVSLELLSEALKLAGTLREKVLNKTRGGRDLDE